MLDKEHQQRLRGKGVQKIKNYTSKVNYSLGIISLTNLLLVSQVRKALNVINWRAKYEIKLITLIKMHILTLFQVLLLLRGIINVENHLNLKVKVNLEIVLYRVVNHKSLLQLLLLQLQVLSNNKALTSIPINKYIILIR